MDVEGGATCASLSIYWSYLFGQSRLPAEAEAALQTAAAPSFTCPTTAIFIAGAYAADRADWTQLAAARASLDSAALARLSKGDSANARQFRLWAEALHGYALARKGETARGIALLQSLQPRVWDSLNGITRWWLGRLLLEDRRPREARRYFASFWYSHPTPASYYLARIDEQLGHYDEARAEYAYFAHAWRNADPAVQPMVTAARARLAVLQGTR